MGSLASPGPTSVPGPRAETVVEGAWGIVGPSLLQPSGQRGQGSALRLADAGDPPGSEKESPTSPSGIYEAAQSRGQRQAPSWWVPALQLAAQRGRAGASFHGPRTDGS
ncbi:unnamed protein product [Rangifer tarandus platyrhynchus]|uniref:Uncharacterized protein n=2 Tax=Rangifer tarandus platyrhynchus TaxID=3082113 RepID=A0AC59ZFN4_RANTA|nr:unnamed protein product [Rangifer tarandus platyrhynchus]